MRILVTGATGFIGMYLCKALSKTEHEVIGIGRDVEKLVDLEKYYNIETHIIHLDAIEECKDLPKDIDVVFHLASQQPNSEELTFEDYLRGNVLTTKNLVDFYKDKKLKVFIYTSTVAIKYQDSDYALSKRFAERILKQIRPRLILRIPTIIGKDYNTFIHYYYTQAKQNKTIKVHSKWATRSFLHVDYLIEALLFVLKNYSIILKNMPWRLEISSIDEMSFQAIVEYIIYKTKSKSEILYNLEKGKLIVADNQLPYGEYSCLDSLNKYIEEMERETD